MGKYEYFCSKIKEERLPTPWRGKGRQLIEGSLPSPCPSTRNVEKIAVPKEEGNECQKDEKRGTGPFHLRFRSISSPFPTAANYWGIKKGQRH